MTAPRRAKPSVAPVAGAWRVRAGAGAPTSARRDAGQGTLEYVGVITLVALLVGALVLAVNPTARQAVVRAACEIVTTLSQSGGCAPGTPDGDADEDRGWWCENVGWFCSDDDEDEQEEQEEDRGWWCETFGWWCPDEPDDEPTETATPTASPTPSAHPTDPANGLPVVDGVTIPEGLDPDGDVVATLLMTERGREILQWLADQGIEVRDSFRGSYWDGTSIFVDTGNTDLETVRTLVHEYNHALNDAQGTSPDIATDTRDDYVNGMLDEETQGVVEEIRAARELEDAGVSMPTDVSDTTYWNAYDQAIADGRSEQEARDAAFGAVRELFINGTFQTSNTGETYEDYYGDAWDERH